MKVENRTRTLKRKPLSDCSNIVTHHISPSLSKTKKPALSPKESDQNSLYDTTAGSDNAENPRVRTEPSTPPHQRSFANNGTVGSENSVLATVYGRKQRLEERKNKGKAVAVERPFSCPPARRFNLVGDKPNEEHGDVDLSKSCIIPHPKSKKNFIYDTSTGSDNAENPSVQTEPSTPPHQRSLANNDTVGCKNSVFVTVYSRKQRLEERKNKGKAVAMEIPFSCPPAGKIRDKPNEEHGNVGLSKSCMVPHPKSKEKWRHSLPKQDVNRPTLPQDFINQQRAYFAEIDAFELPEEFVSDSDIE